MGLGLEDQDRYLLLLRGLEFSKEIAIPDFADFPSELLNFLPYALRRAGISPKDIKKIELPDQKNKTWQSH